MAMPETTVHKNHFFQPGENQVWFAREIRTM
jgi:hypothetical protein